MGEKERKLMEFVAQIDLKTGERFVRPYPLIAEIGSTTYTLADFEQLRDDLDRAIQWLKEGESRE